MPHQVSTVDSSPFEGQKPGTSGLRKKVKVFQQPHYLHNFVQSIFDAIGSSTMRGAHLVLGGDGRFFNREAVDIILKMCAANGMGKVTVGQNGVMSTPAVSAVIRELKAFGGIILTASHNPGGPDNDFGIKYNTSNGGPAPEKITNAIFECTNNVKQYKICHDLKVNINDVKEETFEIDECGKFTVDVIDSCNIYVSLMKTIFDFPKIGNLLQTFNVNIDCLNGVTGPYAERIFVEELKCSPESVVNSKPLEDFGGLHPDPNLTYAKTLVDVMKNGEHDFGAAFDGDGDRNMILGKNAFFVNPSDSLAVIAENAENIPYFQNSKDFGFARSMPTSGAVDLVAQKKNRNFFEVPTGWKFFGNLMDAGLIKLCGEESFGTGSDHIREKDGIWAALAWLQILAVSTDQPSSIEVILKKHWTTYGRNFYSRYDYEEVDPQPAAQVMAHVEGQLSTLPGTVHESGGRKYTVEVADNFSYSDPVDGSVTEKQGLRIVMVDRSRIIFRLSGTGSSGATIRLYIESYEDNKDACMVDAQLALKPLIDVALKISKLVELTGRQEPSVIT